MTKDDIITLARTADVIDFRDADSDPHVAQMVEFLQRFATLVAADFAQARGGGGGRGGWGGRASVSRSAPASRPAPKPAPQRTEPASNPSWFGWWWWHRGGQSNPDCKPRPTTPDRRKECEQ